MKVSNLRRSVTSRKMTVRIVLPPLETREIDASAASPLQLAYAATTGPDMAPRVVLDFNAVDYMNSTGIALIVGILAQARTEHRVVAASGLSDHYRQIFELTRLDEVISIHDTEPAAMAAAS